MIDVQVAKALLKIEAVGFKIQQPITFKSGILSPVYVDNRRLPFFPSEWHIVINAFATLIETLPLPIDVIAGVAVGGIPHSAALAYHLNLPSVFVRKEAKEHGKQQLVEGGDVSGKNVLLIEDMVTTGGSSLSAVTALRAQGATVDHLMAIVSYGFAEATQNYAQANVQFHTLTNFSTIMQVVEQEDSLSSKELSIVQSWLQNPYGWTTPKETVE